MNCISSSRNNYNCFTDSSAMLFLFFFSIFSCVEAQWSPPQDEKDQYARFNPSMAIIMVVLVGALFLLGFLSIYIRRCSEDGEASHHASLSVRGAGRLGAASHGLDGEVLEMFRTFTYYTVKGLKIGKGALECAVCLNEFTDEETIRLIPNCDHVFHVKCIDIWLQNQVTCPVCRSNLVDGSTHRASSSELELGVHENNQTTMVEEGNTDHLPDNRTPILSRIKSAKTFLTPGSKQHLLEKFRSHSTGHSLGVGEDTDTDTERFMLRLPKDVRSKKISNASLKRSESRVSMVAEGSERKGYRTGEGSSTSSSGRIRSYRRMRYDGWVFTRESSFLSRPLSFKSQKTSADNIPLNNVGPKSDDFGSKGDDYGQPPV